jgi:hypothetical protein
MGEDLFVDDERTRRAARRDIKRAVAAVHEQIPVTGPEERLARRREVLPQRLVGGPGVPVALPAAVVEAQEAMRADREFRFEDAQIEMNVETLADESGDDAFNFFADRGTFGARQN